MLTISFPSKQFLGRLSMLRITSFSSGKEDDDTNIYCSVIIINLLPIWIMFLRSLDMAANINEPMRDYYFETVVAFTLLVKIFIFASATAT